MELKIRIAGRVLSVEWENRTAVSAIMNKLSSLKRIQLSKNGIRHMGNLDISVPRNDRSFITSPGDIAIESGKLVFFSGEDDVSCTKLGHITGYSESQIKNLFTPVSLNLELFEG